MLLPWQAKEVGIAVCTSLTSINNIELMKGELQAVSQSLNSDLQVARLERRELVEQGQNGYWIHCNHKDLQTCAKQPQVVEELVASLLNNRQESGEDGRSQDKGQHLPFEHIGDEELRRLLVESEFLLQNKSMVNRRWKRDDLLDDYKAEDKDD